MTGDPRDFCAVTWLGFEKAILTAVHADGRGYRPSDGIYDVLVHEIGPAGRDQKGLVTFGGDLHDRTEF